jgi:putative lipoprotein
MTVPKTRLLAGVALCAALIGPAIAPAIATAETLSGTVTYRERIALPPDAQITVQLQDVSRADAPAQVLGEAVIAPTGQVPVPFALDYDAGALRPGHSYALQARITRGDRLLFINTSRHAVFGPEPDATDILVERVARAPDPATSEPGAAVATPQGRWLAEDIGGKGVLDRIQSVLDLAGDGTVTGSGGCNHLTGKASVDGTGLRFGPLAATRRACIPAVGEQEARFFAALAATRGWQLDAARGKLVLLDAQGQPLMRLARQ